MRVNLNLASQKYEDVRRFLSIAWMSISAMSLLVLILAGLAWINFNDTTKSGARIRDLKQSIAALQEKRAAAEAVENRPENREVNQQKNFWNAEIDRKRFSWTQVLNDLQKLMPGRAYVSSVSPNMGNDGVFRVKLLIVGEKYENALDLVKRMETSERFHNPQIVTEHKAKDKQAGNADQFEIEIETAYIPPTSQPRSRTTRSAKEGF
jgi:Tfp pilus assembly protein PilN